MKTLKDLEYEVRERSDILYKAISFGKDSIYLKNPATEREKNISKEYSMKLGFINKTMYSFWVISVLEMYKLYGGRSDKFKMKTLLDKLLSNYQNSEWSETLKEEEILEWKGKLTSEEYDNIAEKVRTLRNKFYGHKDKDFTENIWDVGPTIDEYEKLMDFTKEIIISIQQKVLGYDDARFKRVSLGKANDILIQLAEYKEIKKLHS